MTRLDEIIDTFQSVDVETRLDLLLDYARKLPAVPPGSRYAAERDAGLHRVPECQTPVFLWVESDDAGRLRIIADVAEESPTVKGFISILADAFAGAQPGEVAGVPSDLIGALGLSDAIRMTRTVGLTAVLARIKREAAGLNGWSHEAAHHG